MSRPPIALDPTPGGTRRGRARASWLVSLAATAVWLVVVLAGSHGSRIVDHWESAATMLAGSFLAGSSPEGGGAVAFPVFTKVLHVDAAVARSFGLFIQAVGMSVAAIAIVVNRRPVHRRVLLIAVPVAIVSFLACATLGGERDIAFWPSSMGSGFAKASFSIILATTAILMVRHLQHGDADHPPMRWTTRVDAGLVTAAALGGGLAAMTGTGANIVVFLFLVALADVRPGVALPSVIIVMAAVSVAGFVLYAGVDGQLSIELTDDRVTRVGDVAFDGPSACYDLFGLWLAAIPVVVWGAPLGSWAASLVSESVLVRFVATLAAVEVVTTIVLVEELRSDGRLLTYLLTGLVVVPGACILMRRHRLRLFATHAG